MGQTLVPARQGLAASMRVTVERGRHWLIFRFPPPTCQAEVDQLDKWRQVREKMVSTAFAGRPATVYVRLPQHEDLCEVLRMPAVLHTVDNAQYQLFSQDCFDESKLNDVTDSLGFELASMWIEGREEPSSVDPEPLSRFASKPLGASGQNVKGASGEEGGDVSLGGKGSLGFGAEGFEKGISGQTSGGSEEQNLREGDTEKGAAVQFSKELDTTGQQKDENLEPGKNLQASFDANASTQTTKSPQNNPEPSLLHSNAVAEDFESIRVKEVITAAEKCDTEEGVPKTEREVCVCVADGTILCWLNPREERKESVLQVVKDLTNELGWEFEECGGGNDAVQASG